MLDIQKFLIALLAIAAVPVGKTEQDVEDLAKAIKDGYEKGIPEETAAFENALINFTNATRPAAAVTASKALLSNIATITGSPLNEIEEIFKVTTANVISLRDSIKAALASTNTKVSYSEFVKEFNNRNITRKGMNGTTVPVILSTEKVGSFTDILVGTANELVIGTALRAEDKNVILLRFTETKKENGTVRLIEHTLAIDANNFQRNVLPHFISKMETSPDAGHIATLPKLKELSVLGSSVKSEEDDASTKLLKAYLTKGKVNIPLNLTTSVTATKQVENETTYTVNVKDPKSAANATNYFVTNSAIEIANLVKSVNPDIEEVEVFHTASNESVTAVASLTENGVKEVNRTMEMLLDTRLNATKAAAEQAANFELQMERFNQGVKTVEDIMNRPQLTIERKVSLARAALRTQNFDAEIIADLLSTYA